MYFTLLRINEKIQRTVIFADFKKANVNFYLSGLSFFKTNNFLMKHKKTWNNEKLHTWKIKKGNLPKTRAPFNVLTST